MEVLEEWRRAQEGSGEGGRRIECELRDVSTRGKYFQVSPVPCSPVPCGHAAALLALALTPYRPPAPTHATPAQSVFLLLSLPEPLRSLHEATRTRLNQTHQPPYMPHVSLLYADIPAEEAQGVIRDMEREGWFEREAGGDGEGVQIRLPSGGAERKVGKIEFDRVELWDCTGEVGGWRCIRGVDL